MSSYFVIIKKYNDKQKNKRRGFVDFMRIVKKIDGFEKIIELDYEEKPELSTKYFTTYHVFEVNGEERKYLYDTSLTPFKLKELERRSFCEGYITKNDTKKVLEIKENGKSEKLSKENYNYKPLKENLDCLAINNCLRQDLKKLLKSLAVGQYYTNIR